MKYSQIVQQIAAFIKVSLKRYRWRRWGKRLYGILLIFQWIGFQNFVLVCKLCKLVGTLNANQKFKSLQKTLFMYSKGQSQCKHRSLIQHAVQSGLPGSRLKFKAHIGRVQEMQYYYTTLVHNSRVLLLLKGTGQELPVCPVRRTYRLWHLGALSTQVSISVNMSFFLI